MSAIRLLALLSLGLVLACGDDDGPRVDGGPSSDGGLCSTDDECDDGLYCNGIERCAPGAGADARGCLVEASPCAAGACDEVADRCTDGCAVPDADGDGAAAIACGGTDCDDTNADVGPEATEVCDPDGVDEDCDPATVGERDADGDGVIDAACCNGASCGADCDDSRSDTRPGATEACNERDDDCDGSVDEGLVLERYWPDADRDGFGDPDGESVMACARPDGYSLDDLDCDDGDVDVSPVAAERCNGVDDDCDGTPDDLEGNVFYRDADGDGWGVATDVTTLDGCEPPTGYVGRVGDCDDARASTNPSATEVCNGVDDDCSSLEAPGGPATNEDADGDMHAPLAAACTGGFPKDDCDDTRPTVHLGAVEICSGLDEDCDTRTDEGTDAQCSSGTCASGCVDDRTFAMAHDAACAIHDGAAYCWGEGPGFLGQSNLVLDESDEMREPVARRIGTLSSLQSIAATDVFACAVQSDRLVRCWGWNHRGQLGLADTVRHDTPVVVGGVTDVVQVAVGEMSACALSADGTVRCWGGNIAGQLGVGHFDERLGVAPVSGLDRVVEIAGSGYTFCARRYDGAVHCWGGRAVGDGTGSDRALPVRVIDSGARRLVAGGYADRNAMCAELDDGWSCWGEHFALGTGGNYRSPSPVVAAASPRTLAYADGNVACAILDDATVGCWGADESRVNGPVLASGSFETAVPVSGLADVVELECGADVCCASDGTTWTCFGLWDSLAMGDGPRDVGPFRTVEALWSPRALAFGRAAGCVVDATGALACFGAATSRALGFVPGGAGWVYPEPVPVALPFEVADVRGREYRFCALGVDGRVACWGGDDAPGDGSVTGAATPQLVDASSMGAVSAIAVGDDFTCALASADGRAWCWGGPTSGVRVAVCGDGGTGCPRPVPVLGDRSFTSLAAGTSHTCGRTSAGEVWCWGFAGSGRLGDGTTTGWSSGPVRAGSFSDVIRIAPASEHTCVLRTGGVVSCVGRGSNGQLGTGTSSSTTFTDVPDTGSATDLVCGVDTCFAQRADGTWVGWGADNGLVGGATSASRQPAPIAAAYGATSALWLGRHTVCSSAAGALSCWGVSVSAGRNQRALPTRGTPIFP
ncbi:MAG: hypothetical protein H6721_09040 [Sandaracinus sp.]|nr:hypothetical protein [Sandaracinus sp.]MCB9632261.1 hypothetical protein [Sandaracinus sp.]